MLATNPAPAPTPSSLLWTRHSPTVQEALLGSVTDGILFTLQRRPDADWAYRLSIETCDGPARALWWRRGDSTDWTGRFLSEEAAKLEAQTWADVLWKGRHGAESGGVKQAAAEGVR